MNNLTDYTALLKLVRYTYTKDENLKTLVFRTYLELVQKPELFDNNLEQLLEVDQQHQILYTSFNDQDLFDWGSDDTNFVYVM